MSVPVASGACAHVVSTFSSRPATSDRPRHANDIGRCARPRVPRHSGGPAADNRPAPQRWSLPAAGPVPGATRVDTPPTTSPRCAPSRDTRPGSWPPAATSPPVASVEEASAADPGRCDADRPSPRPRPSPRLPQEPSAHRLHQCLPSPAVPTDLETARRPSNANQLRSTDRTRSPTSVARRQASGSAAATAASNASAAGRSSRAITALPSTAVTTIGPGSGRPTPWTIDRRPLHRRTAAPPRPRRGARSPSTTSRFPPGDEPAAR